MFNKIKSNNKSNEVRWSIIRSLINQNGETFNIGDIVNVVYDCGCGEVTCSGRLTHIIDNVFFDTITIDSSEKMNSKEEYIEVKNIKSIKLI